MTLDTQRERARETPPTPQQASQLIDVDVHERLRDVDELLPYLPSVWQEKLSKTWLGRGEMVPTALSYILPWGSGRGDWALDGSEGGANVHAMRRHLFEQEGVSVAILNGFFHVSSYESSVELACALGAAYNDWQIEQWLAVDERFRGSVHVVAHTPELAAREIDRVAEHPQIVQAFLPLVTTRQYGDPFYRPIFEAAVRNDLAVTFHHGAETRVAQFGYPRYMAEWHTLSAPLAGQIQLTSLLFNGVFDKMPDLKIVLLETGGAWLPWFMWRADENFKQCRAEVPWVRKLPSEHIRDSVRVGTQPLADLRSSEFAQIVKLAGLERVFMFSTDYPHYDAESADTVLPESLPESLRARVRYGNALETFPRLRAMEAA